MLNPVTLLIGYCDYAAIYSWINYMWDYLYKRWVGFPFIWNSIKTFMTIDQGKAYTRFVFTLEIIFIKIAIANVYPDFFPVQSCCPPFISFFLWDFMRCFIQTGNSANSAASCPHIFKSLKVYWKYDLQFFLVSTASLQIALCLSGFDFKFEMVMMIIMHEVWYKIV